MWLFCNLFAAIDSVYVLWSMESQYPSRNISLHDLYTGGKSQPKPLSRHETNPNPKRGNDRISLRRTAKLKCLRDTCTLCFWSTWDSRHFGLTAAKTRFSARVDPAPKYIIVTQRQPTFMLIFIRLNSYITAHMGMGLIVIEPLGAIDTWARGPTRVHVSLRRNGTLFEPSDVRCETEA